MAVLGRGLILQEGKGGKKNPTRNKDKAKGKRHRKDGTESRNKKKR